MTIYRFFLASYENFLIDGRKDFCYKYVAEIHVIYRQGDVTAGKNFL